MQKHKFVITYPGAFLWKLHQAHPEHQKECVDVLCPGSTGMQYVTHRSHRMQKLQFVITYPGAPFCDIHTSPTRA
jgi:hypothetical protein